MLVGSREWRKMNRRRGELIQTANRTPAQELELSELQELSEKLIIEQLPHPDVSELNKLLEGRVDHA